MTRTHIVLIRHGHTASNGGGPQAVMNGWADLPLSDQGRREVSLLAEYLVAHDEHFDAVYTSPLSRARDTARALELAGLGVARTHEGLKEIDCGEVDGLPLEVVRARFPSLWEANLQQNDPFFCWPGGETYAQLRARSIEAMLEIARRHAGQRVAVVTHAGVIGQVLGALSGESPARWERFRPGNTARSELAWDGRVLALVRFDVRDHLAPEYAL